MKKFILMFSLMFFFSISVFSTNQPKCFFDKWGIQYSSSYEKYIGKKVIYIPRTNKYLSYYDEQFPGKPNTEYTITNIKSKEEQIIIFLEENETKNKVKWKVYKGPQIYSYGGRAFNITRDHTIPLFFYEDFEKDKIEFIGKEYKNSRVKITYKVVDFILAPSSSYDDYPVLSFVLQNSESGEKITLPYKTPESEINKKYIDRYLTGKYYAVLSNIEKPLDKSNRYGKSETIEELGVTKFSYVDDVMNIIIFLTEKQFNFTIKNISENSIKIIWDEAGFVDYEGFSDKIIHSGVKFSEKNNPQPPSIIMKGASFSDIAVPVSRVKYYDYIHEWLVHQIFPVEKNKSLIQVRLMLPIQIKDIINEYIFTFDAKWEYDYPQYLTGE